MNQKELKELLQKELEVNEQEQLLLQQRISTMKEAINAIPNLDPEYYVLDEQILADEITLEEYKLRQEALLEQLKKLID